MADAKESDDQVKHGVLCVGLGQVMLDFSRSIGNSVYFDESESIDRINSYYRAYQSML